MSDDFFNGFCEEEDSTFSPGEHFRGYEVQKLLGRGAAGSVYLVRHEMLDSLLALKLMVAPSRDTTADDPSVKRFIREAKIAATIQHPNLVRVHDAGFDQSKNAYWLVMDYMSGGTLRERIGMGGPVPVLEAVEIVRSISSALDAGTRFNVVHRDIKPENIMFTKEGRPKLVDLGIAKVSIGDSLCTNTGETFGTPAYMSPEQAVDSSSVDARADIYSLGIVLYEMICGRTPFAGGSARSIIAQVMDSSPIPDIKRVKSDVPNWVSALLFRMCAKDKDKRIASHRQLLDEIARYTGKKDSSDEGAEYSEAVSPASRRLVNTPEEDAAVDAVIETKRRLRRRKAIIRKTVLLVLAAAAIAALVAVLL